MPRFTTDESAILIELAETFAATTADPKIRAKLNSATRKMRQAHDHHTRRAAEKARKQS